MIILDTNVVSEVMRGGVAEPRVITWIRGLAEQPAITAITRAEIMSGIALLPHGSRRDRLLADALDTFAGFSGFLAFDADSADAYAAVQAERTALGRPISALDAMIAAVARSTGSGLATRNTADFGDLGLRLANPWA